MRTVLHLLLRFLYRFRGYGIEATRGPGPMLLCPNHVSWFDWLFLGVLLEEDWKFVTSSVTARTSWLHRRIMVNARTFPVDPTSAYAVRDMADFLAGGGKLVLFPEGRISQSGGLMKLQDGAAFLVQRTGARLVTAYLRGARRLPWVRHPGWTRWFPQVSVHFSQPVRVPEFPGVAATLGRRRAANWVRARMLDQQFNTEHVFGPRSLPAALGEAIAANPDKVILEDASFTEISYRRLGLGSRLLADRFSRLWSAEPGRRVGVLLPNVNGLAVTLLALWRLRQVPAILNFSSGMPVMRSCLGLACIQEVVTARAFVEKAKLDLTPLEENGIRILYLEDVRASIGTLAKMGAAVVSRFSPACGLSMEGLGWSDTAVVLFTSGSEGVPKGVELTHGNLLANARQIDCVMDATESDRFFNALPLFHSLGLVGGLIYPLLRGCYTFLYVSPLHYRIVPQLVYDRSCTVLLGTNTFLNGYARKAHPYDFQSVRLLVAGAEKVLEATALTWARRFGIRILEGYGATECSPVISVNSRVDPNPASAGRFLPGLEHRLEPVEGVELGGRLWVRGPNVMKGYLNGEANAKFLAGEGWYDTGDIVRVDEEGFVFIQGRMKRFAKVSGEMVSLTAVEDAIAGGFPQFGPRCQVAIVAVPDEDKGEKLIAVTNESRVTLPELRALVRAKGLSNLCAPRELRTVQVIPKLGTGKTDYRALEAGMKT
jgi:acyl-[acyl-carrier-protein]-phospholipid O-acyltransferase / long-chain-fatty-acid--[acyl-carrier-protein] ligase